MSNSPELPKQMKQKDYFQPLDKHVRVSLWTEAHTEQVKLGIVQGLFYGVAFFIIAMMTFNDYPHIEEGTKHLGLGAYKMCAESCEDCHKQYHDHYLKAWRKVK